MSERAQTAASLTRRAAERIDAGEIEDARRVLAEALALDPSYEPAWLWFAYIAEDPGERRFCLEQAASANPESRALQDLAALRRVVAVEPPEVADLVSPIPPRIVTSRPAIARRFADLPRRRWLALTLLVLTAALVAAAVLFTVQQRGDALYVAVVDGDAATNAAGSGESFKSAQLYFDRLNAEGGIDGHPVELLRFNDAGDLQTAENIAHQIVADNRILLVIGHRTSTTSLAAAPIYAAAGLPAITGSATADALTQGTPWYFRTIFDNESQGKLIAAYARNVLGADHISVLNGTGDYGRSLATGVIGGFGSSGGIRHVLEIDESSAERLDATVSTAVTTLASDQDSGPIILALQADSALKAMEALNAAGVMTPVIGGDAIGSNAFLAELHASSGTNASHQQLLAAAPLYLDALTSDALRWRIAFRSAYGEEPTWRGATTYDAAIAAAPALSNAMFSGAETDVTTQRARVRDALASFNGPDHAIPGLLGPIYFDQEQTTPRAAVFGVESEQEFISAPDQLKPYSPSAGTTLEEDLASGAAVNVDGQLLGRQRVVHAGVDVNELGELDTANPSFYADFFLWFNYRGDDAATDIAFVNAADPTLTLGEPLRSTNIDGTIYKLFRVTGRFKAPLEFQDFPFDKQHLLISIENRILPSSRLVYAVDPQLGDETQAERLQSGTNASASIDAIPNWEPVSIYFYQQTVGSTAFLGDPEVKLNDAGLEYSLFTTDITIERNLVAFLVKNLLPLALLAAITYVSLFFSHKQTAERVSIGISGILTAAVLLTSVTGALPQVGYTVAIEWGFYAFIFLAATCVLIALAGDRLYEERRLSDLRRLDIFSRIYYPAFILFVVLIYASRYAT